jgi:hypothetical protein
MNAIVAGKVEKPEGSLVFKTEQTADLYNTDYTFYTNITNKYIKVVTKNNLISIICACCTDPAAIKYWFCFYPEPYNNTVWTQFTRPTDNSYVNIIMYDNDQNFLNLNDYYTSIELGVLE